MTLAWSLYVRYGAVLFRGHSRHFGILCGMLENPFNVLFASQKQKYLENRLFWRIWPDFHQCYNVSGLAQNNWGSRLISHFAVLVSLQMMNSGDIYCRNNWLTLPPAAMIVCGLQCACRHLCANCSWNVFICVRWSTTLTWVTLRVSKDLVLIN